MATANPPETTPRKTLWVCTACGKTSNDRYGRDPVSRGWDAACAALSIECYADRLVYGDGESPKVTGVLDGGVVEQQGEAKTDGK